MFAITSFLRPNDLNHNHLRFRMHRIFRKCAAKVLKNANIAGRLNYNYLIFNNVLYIIGFHEEKSFLNIIYSSFNFRNFAPEIIYLGKKDARH